MGVGGNNKINTDSTYINNQKIKTKLVREAIRRMLSAYVSYLIWKWLEQSRNMNIGKEKANYNLSIMNTYPQFFNNTLKSSFYCFVIDLSVFFDRDPRSLSVYTLIRELQISKKNQGLIGKIMKKQADNIQFLKTLRDKLIAHSEYKFDAKTFEVIIYEKIESLFTATQQILNIVTLSYEHSVSYWTHLKAEIENEMESLFNKISENSLS